MSQTTQPAIQPPLASEFITAIRAIAQVAHANSRAKGFWEPAASTEGVIWKLSRIALMHSELSECAEGIRKDLIDDHLTHRTQEVAELADTVIRILDYAGAYNLPLGEVIVEKMAYNAGRPHLHGKKPRTKIGKMSSAGVGDFHGDARPPPASPPGTC